MNLEDAYEPDSEDELPLDQEAEEWDEETLGLDWSESDVQEVAREIARL